jgi:hypothetical protein
VDAHRPPRVRTGGKVTPAPTHPSRCKRRGNFIFNFRDCGYRVINGRNFWCATM